MTLSKVTASLESCNLRYSDYMLVRLVFSSSSTVKTGCPTEWFGATDNLKGDGLAGGTLWETCQYSILFSIIDYEFVLIITEDL